MVLDPGACSYNCNVNHHWKSVCLKVQRDMGSKCLFGDMVFSRRKNSTSLSPEEGPSCCFHLLEKEQKPTFYFLYQRLRLFVAVCIMYYVCVHSRINTSSSLTNIDAARYFKMMIIAEHQQLQNSIAVNIKCNSDILVHWDWG